LEWEKNLKRFDGGIPSPGFHLIANPLGILLVVGRAEVMRMRGEPLHILAKIVRIGNRAERGFQLELGFRIGGRKAVERGGIACKSARTRAKSDDKAKDCGQEEPTAGGVKVFHIGLTRFDPV